MRPDFPLVWDNSMRSAFVACPQLWAYEYLEHWKSQYPNVDLHAGKAWAEALEKGRRAFYVDGADSDQALVVATQALFKAYGSFQCPSDSPKSLERLSEALIYYWEVFPLDQDPVQPYVGRSGPMIEFSFALPLDDNLVHPVTGEPIIFAGRADMVATYAGSVSIYDDKTTKQLGPTWGQKWDLRAQFTGYVWAAQQYGIPVSQAVVRAVSILKTKLDHAQAITPRTAWRVETWHKQFVRDVKRAIECWQEGYFDRAESDACDSYGGCAFRQPCMHPDAAPYLKLYFHRKVWNPVNRTETLVDDHFQPILLPSAPDLLTVGNINDFNIRKV